MTRRCLKLTIAGNLFTLTACTQRSEIRQMHQSVNTLSQEMIQLNQQTIKIIQQNALNAKSTRGIYLSPEAKTLARPEGQIGTLRMSMGSTTPDDGGLRLTLRIQGESNGPLSTFTAIVTSGQITGITYGHQEVNAQDQLINAPASILAPSDVDIPLCLNVTPDKVGFICVHGIQSAAAQ